MRRSRGPALQVALGAIASLTADGCSRGEARAVALDAAEAPGASGACARTFEVVAEVSGGWAGSAIDESGGMGPGLYVGLAEGSAASPAARTVASLRLAPRPFYAAELAPGDLCTDDGSTAKDLAVRCAVGGAITRVRVHDEGHALSVRVGDAPPTRWSLEPWPRACFTLKPMAARHDVEAARATWGRDAPSARCEGKGRASTARVAITFPLLSPEDAPSCAGDGASRGPRAATGLRVEAAGTRVDLGTLANQCAGLRVTRFAGVDAIALGTSDMGVERRYAYRLGDRLYLVGADDRVRAVDLPCGARVAFDVKYPWREGLEVQSEPSWAR